MLPTPQARDGDNRGPADPARRRAGGHQVNLHDAVDAVMKLLPTPTASDAKNCTRRTQTGGPSLPDQARLLLTARASNTGMPGRRAEPGFRPPLSQQVLPLVDPEAFLPTPRATDGTKGCPAQRGSKGDLMLPSAVMRLVPFEAGDGIS
jgi:DNA (cytosine-5)-methyltransferase 1